jgi:hypothetical protein
MSCQIRVCISGQWITKAEGKKAESLLAGLRSKIDLRAILDGDGSIVRLVSTLESPESLDDLTAQSRLLAAQVVWPSLTP